MKVIVVGAGVVGLSVAWALNRRGHRVAVYEQGPIPNPLGSSCDQSRLIRHAYGGRTGYARMVREAYAAWELLWSDLGERLYAATGTLCLVREGNASPWVDLSLGDMEKLGVPAEEVTHDRLAEWLPFLDARDVTRAVFSPTGGVLYAASIVDRLAKHLRREGQTVQGHTRVAEVDPERARVTTEGGKVAEADALVVAAGPWAPRLVPGLRGRVTPSRQKVVYLVPPPEHAAAWREAPMILDQVAATRGGFYAVPPVRGADLKMGDHAFTLDGDPDGDRAVGEAEAEAITALCRGRIAGFDAYRVKAAHACFYSVTEDERFVAEREGAAWALSPCSGHGFKFGAVMGLAVADAVEGHMPAASLAEWAAGRVG